jgi:hypothetical protein
MTTARNDSTGDKLVSKVLVQESKENFDIGYEVIANGVKNEDGTVTLDTGVYKFVDGKWVALGWPPIDMAAQGSTDTACSGDVDEREEVCV